MDLIDRQAAIEAIWSHATKILESSDYDVFIQDIYKMVHRHIAELIKQLPSAHPEQASCRQVTGKMVDADRIKKLARIESADVLEPVKSVLPMAVEWIVDKALEEMK